MAEKYVTFIVADTMPTDVSASDGWLWLDTANKKLFRYQGYADGSWVEKPLNIPIATLFSEDVTFSKKIYADDKQGITQVVTLSQATKLKFKKGILWEVE